MNLLKFAHFKGKQKRKAFQNQMLQIPKPKSTQITD